MLNKDQISALKQLIDSLDATNDVEFKMDDKEAILEHLQQISRLTNIANLLSSIDNKLSVVIKHLGEQQHGGYYNPIQRSTTGYPGQQGLPSDPGYGRPTIY